VDRFGGRLCFFIVLLGVAVFGGVSALALSLPMLGAGYLANRFFGAGGWASMVKLVADWFPPRHMALALAFLSTSIVIGGVGSLLLTGQIATATGNNWHAVLGLPSLVLLLIIGVCWLVMTPAKTNSGGPSTPSPRWSYRVLFELVRIPQFWMLCGLAFTLTITRETFNFWTVDFFKTEGGAQITMQQAAWLSIPFDAMGAIGIIALGWLLDRVTNLQRKWLLFSILMCVAVATYALPSLAHGSRWRVVVDMGLIGLLSYGPYCLPAGLFALEIRGKDCVASVAGLVDAAGYLAGIISGYVFGRILDLGGYQFGFHCLAITTVIGALLCFGLNRPSKFSPAATQSK
jgi:OPA family glycerol-3-phosphate transporter-like MFS transporter